MNVLILAAGEGKRLRPHTLDKPKSLVELADKSLLGRQIEVLRSCGVKNVVCVGGYRSEMLRDYCDTLICNDDYRDTNMVWSFLLASKHLMSDTLISYGDIVYSPRLVTKIRESAGDIVVPVDVNWRKYWASRTTNIIDDVETLKVSSQGLITEIGGRPTSLDEIEGQYMGLIKTTQAGLRQLKDLCNRALSGQLSLRRPLRESYLTDLLQGAIDCSVEVRAHFTKEPWVEIDTVQDLLAPVSSARVRLIDQLLEAKN